MEPLETIERCSSSTLSQVVDEYLINRGIDKKKHFGKYLVISQRVWQEIFWNTLWIVKTVWLPLKKGDPYHYIDVPRDKARIFSINSTDDCGKLVPLYYNNQLNVVSRPKIKKCGCTRCDCGGICEDVNGLTATTNLLFTINGIDYYEKTWLKYCPNGDVWEYKEVPTKKYATAPVTGDYNEDYDNDFSIQSDAFSNFTIVTETFQKKICALAVKPCGCPEETDANQQLLIDNCGCFLSFSNTFRRCYCDQFLADPAPNIYGQVKISECGTRIYYKPPLHRFKQQCVVGPGPIPRLPEFLQVSYQTSGKNVGSDTLVPDFALMAMWTGIDWRSKLFNSRYPWSEKKGMEYQFNDAVNKIIMFLSPLNMEKLSYIQDSVIRW